MIKKDDYIKAKEIVAEYQKQIVESFIECYIMKRTTDDFMFVTTDKEYADYLYRSGEYIMKISQLSNP
jgi:hypothetical protein